MRSLLLLCLLASMVCLAPAAEAVSNPEIIWLLQYIEKADGKFIRSGREYTPQEGADHLRMKLGKAGGKVKTAEDFIDGIATKSYLNGDPYLVKLKDGRTRPTGQWLREALSAHRAQK